MSGSTLKFNNIWLNRKEFRKSKQPIQLGIVTADQIVICYKFKHSGEGFEYFIGYQEGEIVKPLCIILSQMSGCIKYFENGGKNMSFLIKDDEVQEKHKQIWDVIKNKLGIKFHSEPISEQKYLKAKIREFDGVIKTNFLGNGTPKEGMHYTCIACITIDSVMKIGKKNYPQVCSEECKYTVKKMQMSRFIKSELDSDSDSDSEAESISATELMAKLKSESDSE